MHASFDSATLQDTHPCPSILPFVVAFCASSLRCMEDADNAGKGKGVDSVDSVSCAASGLRECGFVVLGLK